MIQIDSTDLPDDPPVLIAGRHCLRVTDAEVIGIHRVNLYGQAQPDHEGTDGTKALLFHDRSTG